MVKRYANPATSIGEIRTGFVGGNLFNFSDGIDLAASVSNYAVMLEDALQQFFPSAWINIRHSDYRTSGAPPKEFLTKVYDHNGYELSGWDATVNKIAEDLHRSQKWLVPLQQQTIKQIEV